MKILWLVPLSFVLACSTLVIDPSMSAVEANDYTLMQSICEAAPGRGVDVCRAKEGTLISSDWVIVLPNGSRVKGGEVTVQYRDLTKVYPITGPSISIPLKDLMGHDSWKKEDEGTAVVWAKVIFDSGTGLDSFIARGFGFFIVTDSSYDPMPIDSGFSAFQTDCKFQYSTSGRSASKCK